MTTAVKIADFEPYANYMHINSIVVFSIGMFTIYLTLFHSPKEMGHYKYYILNFQTAASLFDLHLSFIYTPLPILPAPAMCSTSIFFINSPWYYEYVNYIIMHFTLSYVGVSIFVGVMYRYYALRGNLYFFHSKKGIAIIAFCSVFYATPVFIALIFALSDREETMKFFKKAYPGYYDMFLYKSCHGMSNPMNILIYAGVAAVQITAVVAGSAIAMLKINNLMKEKKAMLTKKTYSLHRQLMYSLWVQSILPICFIAVPTVAAFMMILTPFADYRTINLASMPILCLHSAVLGLSTIVMTKPYRKATITILLKPIRLFIKPTGQVDSVRVFKSASSTFT